MTVLAERIFPVCFVIDIFCRIFDLDNGQSILSDSYCLVSIK